MVYYAEEDAMKGVEVLRFSVPCGGQFFGMQLEHLFILIVQKNQIFLNFFTIYFEFYSTRSY
jgi:hypothetical protein